MAVLKGIREREAEIDFIICPIEDRYALLKRSEVIVEKAELDSFEELREQVTQTLNRKPQTPNPKP